MKNEREGNKVVVSKVEQRIKDTIDKYLRLISLKADKNVLDMILKEIEYLKELRGRLSSKA